MNKAVNILEPIVVCLLSHPPFFLLIKLGLGPVHARPKKEACISWCVPSTCEARLETRGGGWGGGVVSFPDSLT